LVSTGNEYSFLFSAILFLAIWVCLTSTLI
jgi:hypothetical protein